MDYYSFNRPWRDGWLSWPCWLTDSGRFTHKVVTRPAISLAQDTESSPARTGGLTTMLRHQLIHNTQYTPPTRLHSTVASHRRRRCVLGLTALLTEIRVLRKRQQQTLRRNTARRRFPTLRCEKSPIVLRSLNHFQPVWVLQQADQYTGWSKRWYPWFNFAITSVNIIGVGDGW